MGMDRKLEKKKGIRPKHIVYAVAGIAFILLAYKNNFRFRSFHSSG
jgi:HlyD family secretion protein